MKEKILLVIAHPDDEIIYFLPFLIASKTNSIDLHIICMTSGENRLRCCEFVESMKYWNTPYEILNHPIQRSKFPEYELSILKATDRLEIGISRYCYLVTHGFDGDDRCHPQHAAIFKSLKKISKRYHKPLLIYDVTGGMSLLQTYKHYLIISGGNFWTRKLKAIYRTALGFYWHLYYSNKKIVKLSSAKKIIEKINREIYKSESLFGVRHLSNSWVYSSRGPEFDEIIKTLKE